MKRTMMSLRVIALLAAMSALVVWGCAQMPASAPAVASVEANPGPAAQAPDDDGDEPVLVGDDLNAQWQRPVEDGWMAAEMEKHMIVRPADNSDLIGNQAGHTYGKITEMDTKVWEHETMKLVVRGSEVFHSAGELGSEIAVSCDMCHPDGSNTHPETYPKFQVQMGRVAHLRDMINWCIEQAVKGPKLEPDDPNMRALEAYILAQRKGEELNYGRR